MPTDAPAQPDIEPETDGQFRTRALNTLKEIAELGMNIVRNAGDRCCTNKSTRPDPTALLDFQRAAAIVRQVLALEHRIRNTRASQKSRYVFGPRDPRRMLVRKPLHDHLKIVEPDPAARRQAARTLDECIDQHLTAEPDAKPYTVFEAVCADLDLHPDPKTLSDELLGMPPRPGNAPFWTFYPKPREPPDD